MPPLVVQGAMCMCSFGVAPATVMVTSQMKAMVNNMPIATIQDVPKLPGSFGSCLGALWVVKASPPPPCAPAIVAWTPGCAVTKINNVPAVNISCTANCAAGGGVITITNTPAMTTDAK